MLCAISIACIFVKCSCIVVNVVLTLIAQLSLSHLEYRIGIFGTYFTGLIHQMTALSDLVAQMLVGLYCIDQVSGTFFGRFHSTSERHS